MPFDHRPTGAGDLGHSEQVQPIMDEITDDAVPQRISRCAGREQGRFRGGLDRPFPGILVPGSPSARDSNGALGSLSLDA